MKNTLLLITILFSFHAFGADKPKTEFDKQGNLVTDIGASKVSKTGLEGWGKKGVAILIDDYSEGDGTFPLKEIKRKVELKLLQAGIKATDKLTGADIIIKAQPTEVGDRIVGYAVSIRTKRMMEFKALDNTGKLVTYRIFASSSQYGGLCGPDSLIKFIDILMDQLLLDYLKANPKKKD